MAGEHRWIQINGVPTMDMDKAMKPTLMGQLKILPCTHMVHMLVIHSTPNRCVTEKLLHASVCMEKNNFIGG